MKSTPWFNMYWQETRFYWDYHTKILVEEGSNYILAK